MPSGALEADRRSQKTAPGELCYLATVYTHNTAFRQGVRPGTSHSPEVPTRRVAGKWQDSEPGRCTFSAADIA
jgi:hypothetical protein